MATTRPPKPPAKLLRLARQALPKARRNRTAAEQRAVRLTRAWRLWKQQQGGSWLDEGPMTQADMWALAGQQAADALVPEQQELEREQRRAAQEAAAQQGLIRRLAGDLGATVAPVAGNMQQAYQQAAAAQGALAQGFSGAMAQTAQAEAARNAADLAKWGGQVQAGDVAAASQGASDPLYGTGGFLPGASLAQQGASWGAYGASLPAVVARMGQQDAGNVASAYAALQKDLSDRAAELAAKLPGLRAQFMETLKQDELSRASYRQAMKAFGLDQQAAGAARKQQQFENQITASQNELDWAQFQAQEEQAQEQRRSGGEGRSTPKKRREARENLEALFSSNAAQVAKALTVVVEHDFIPDEKKMVPLAQAIKAVRQMFAQEILATKRAGVKDTAITAMIRRFLASLGYNTAPAPTASSGGFWGEIIGPSW